MFGNILKARRDTLDDAFESLSEEEFDLAEKYIDLFIDYLEAYEPEAREKL